MRLFSSLLTLSTLLVQQADAGYSSEQFNMMTAAEAHGLVQTPNAKRPGEPIRRQQTKRYNPLMQLCGDIRPALTPEHEAIARHHTEKQRTKGDQSLYQYASFKNFSTMVLQKGHQPVLVITGQELVDPLLCHLANQSFIDNREKILVLLDLKRGDGLVSEDGTLSLKRKHLNVFSLYLSDRDRIVTKIGNSFLKSIRNLQMLDLSDLTEVSSIARDFCAFCPELTQVTFPKWEKLTTIYGGFMRRCESLRQIDLAFMRHVQKVYGDICHGCTGLTHVDASHLRILTHIRCVGGNLFDAHNSPYGFFTGCTGLRSIDLSGLINVREVRRLLEDCPLLHEVQLPENPPKELVCALVESLQNSDEVEQQKMGQDLFQKYLLVLPEHVQKILDQYQLEVIRTNTPAALEDIPELEGRDVVNRYQAVMDQVGGMLETDVRTKFEQRLMPILQNLFDDPTVHVTWEMYRNNKDELMIAIKHILRKLQDLMAGEKGRQEAVSYMRIFLESFTQCQSRQAGDINQITGGLGLTGGIIQGVKEQQIWQWINEFKFHAFTKFDRGNTNAHEHMCAFTVVNNAICLPVAMRSFQERISRLSAEEMQEQLNEFLTRFFTPEQMVNFIREKLMAEDSPLDAQKVRSTMVQLEEEGTITSLEDYFWALAGAEANENYDPLESPITKGEVRRLLELLRALKPIQMNVQAEAGGEDK